MLTLEQCKKILSKGDRKYTNEEITKLRSLLYELAEIEYQQKKVKENEQKSNYLHTSFN